MKILLNNPLKYVYVNPTSSPVLPKLPGALTARPQTPPQLLWWSIRDAQSAATRVKNPS